MTRPYHNLTAIRGGGASVSSSSSDGSSNTGQIYVSADPTDHYATQTVRLMEEMTIARPHNSTLLDNFNQLEVKDINDMYEYTCNNDTNRVIELLNTKEWCRLAINNKYASKGNTLLHVAAEEDNATLVRMLLQEYNANPFITNDFGLEPSSMAAPNTDAFKLLVAAEDRLSGGERKIIKRGAVKGEFNLF
ncbi:hypothetical protein FOL47_007523 [Perkinsus chesapeaki]|uniref:Uncharacterized protein n=1 Tax=Perkinsus chesapeaki TaxID=330153 RepID=A0A7J6LK56_PERCH|nr:hypothetical protein FOL47_007523 [Perkinsus chesapeaki]